MLVQMDMDQFLSHRGGGFSGGSFFKNWKKEGYPIRDEGLGNGVACKVWLHTRAPYAAFWMHPWPRLVELEDDDGEKEIVFWGGRWGCHEREVILRRQWKRDDQGEREYPPEKCPMDLMIECVRSKVEAGELDWTKPVFRFEATDADKTIELTAGGLYNAFGSRDLTREQIKELRKAGINRNDAWRESMMPKCNYVFCVVDAEDPGEGCGVLIETEALGNAVKRAINDAMRRAGKNRENGNPVTRPYPFEFQFFDKQEFSRKYNAIPIDSGPDSELPDDVRQLIIDEEPPAFEAICADGNCRELRAQFEQYAVVDLPWDEIFGPAEKAGLMEERAEEEDDEQQEPEQSRPRGKPAKPTNSSASAAKAREKEEEPEDDEDPITCDHCSEPMDRSEFVCSKCGSSYDKSGAMLSRPCLHCDEQVDLPVGEARVICGKCGAIHEVVAAKSEDDPDGWELAEAPAEKKKAAKKAPQRRSTVTKKGGAAAPKRDKIPFDRTRAKRAGR